MNYTLNHKDRLFITTVDNVTHEAEPIESTNYGLYVKLLNFGNLTIKWQEIWTIHKLIQNSKIKNEFTPRYKVLIWRNDHNHAS